MLARELVITSGSLRCHWGRDCLRLSKTMPCGGGGGEAGSELSGPDGGLIAGLEVCVDDVVAGEIAVAESDDRGGAFAVGNLELSLGGTAGGIGVGGNAGSAKLAEELPVG